MCAVGVFVGRQASSLLELKAAPNIHRRYFSNLQFVSGQQQHDIYGGFGRYLCRAWNEGRRESDRVHAFSIVLVAEHTTLVPREGEGGTLRSSERVQPPRLLWRHACFDVPIPPPWHAPPGPWRGLLDT